MGLFDWFRKRKDERAATPSPKASLPSICYGIAYFILPHYAYKDCDKLIAMFRDTPASAGPFFYFMGCQLEKREPVDEDVPLFRSHHGELDGTHDYFVLEYPTPPPVDFTNLSDPTLLPPEQLPVLAPHFSAIVRHRDTKAVSYFTLGQAPFGGGTTFRSVTPEGLNCNHGPGPEPRLEAFLARLRSAG